LPRIEVVTAGSAHWFGIVPGADGFAGRLAAWSARLPQGQIPITKIPITPHLTHPSGAIITLLTIVLGIRIW
jgi:hypothetical protein